VLGHEFVGSAAQSAAPGIDEGTRCTGTTADFRATVDALHRGVLGDLARVEERALHDGPQAFVDLDQGKSASAKIVLRP
jgi:threonine dehydrogenase-like Zn-dependent dehydrogenase